MKLWIALYHHRHGVDAMPNFQDEEPQYAQVIKDIDDSGADYEGPGGRHPENEQRDDEWIEVHGAWYVPAPSDLLEACQCMLDELDPDGDEPTHGTRLGHAAIARANGCISPEPENSISVNDVPEPDDDDESNRMDPLDLD